MTDHIFHGQVLKGHQLSGYSLVAETIINSRNFGRVAASREMAATLAYFKEGCAVGEEMDILQGYIFGLLVAAQSFVDEERLL